MATELTLQAETEWYADDMEMETALVDDDFEFDEEGPGDDEDIAERQSEVGGSVPVWRLIEMSRENRFLQKELADFEDYDDFDSRIDSYGSDYSH